MRRESKLLDLIEFVGIKLEALVQLFYHFIELITITMGVKKFILTQYKLLHKYNIPVRY
jgi:hypothetical protein